MKSLDKIINKNHHLSEAWEADFMTRCIHISLQEENNNNLSMKQEKEKFKAGFGDKSKLRYFHISHQGPSLETEGGGGGGDSQKS